MTESKLMFVLNSFAEIGLNPILSCEDNLYCGVLRFNLVCTLSNID